MSRFSQEQKQELEEIVANAVRKFLPSTSSVETTPHKESKKSENAQPTQEIKNPNAVLVVRHNSQTGDYIGSPFIDYIYFDPGHFPYVGDNLHQQCIKKFPQGGRNISIENIVNRTGETKIEVIHVDCVHYDYDDDGPSGCYYTSHK